MSETKKGQCEYHYGKEVSGLRLVKLAAAPGVWQAPMWICPECRKQLRGCFKYAGKEAPK
ncbi:MAG TPA: hypothetical protein VMX79_12910 [bacterium]|nr:hypothetical protein [bacterium]